MARHFKKNIHYRKKYFNIYRKLFFNQNKKDLKQFDIQKQNLDYKLNNLNIRKPNLDIDYDFLEEIFNLVSDK